jgi:hypothetical protein
MNCRKMIHLFFCTKRHLRTGIIFDHVTQSKQRPKKSCTLVVIITQPRLCWSETAPEAGRSITY